MTAWGWARRGGREDGIVLERRCCVARSKRHSGGAPNEGERGSRRCRPRRHHGGGGKGEGRELGGGRWVKGSGPEPHFIFMQLLISVEPDTRRAYPTVLSLNPPPVHRPPRSYLPTLLPRRLLGRPSANSTSCRRASCRLVPESYPLAPFAAGWRRVTSLSKNGRCRLSLVPFCLSLFFRALTLVRICLFSSSILLPHAARQSLFQFGLSLPLLLCLFCLSIFPSHALFPPFSFSPLSSTFSLSHSRGLLSAISLLSFSVSLFLARKQISRFLLLSIVCGSYSLSLSPFTAATSIASSIVAHTPTCSVAGWPSLACRRRRTRDPEQGDGRTRAAGHLHSAR